jgi:murein DD-endopeptidase MepM/ murein hydrolase activator NlpD
MVIPHNSIRPIRIRFSVTLLLGIAVSWTFLTISAGYLYSRHIDYLRIRADHELMKLKVVFFAQEVKKSQEMLEQVKENDEQVRALLQMKSKKAIIESETQAQGGPTIDDAHDLSMVLSGKLNEMSREDIVRQTTALQEETQHRLSSYREIFSHVQAERALFLATPNLWPCTGHLTSVFGFRIHPLSHRNEFHAGLDIANSRNTPIYATSDGLVRIASWQPGYGRMVIIDHGFKFTTLYGHMNRLLVKEGQRVHRGQMVGLMGSTGSSTGDHCHYEVRYKGNVVNPVRYLKKTVYQLPRNNTAKAG